MHDNVDNQATESNNDAQESSLRDDLMAAFNGDTNLVQNNDQSDVVTDDESQEDQELNESNEPDTQDQNGQEEDEASLDMPVFQAPVSWNKEEKQLFDNLPDELELENGDIVPIKEIISKYDKSRSSDYRRKTMEVAEMRKEYQPLKELIEPYKDNFEKMGIKPSDYMSKLINLDISLHNDPLGTIKQAMETFKITPEKLGLTDASESDNDSDFLTDEEKKIAELEKKIKALEGKTDANEQTLAQRDSQAKVSKILKDFENATNDSGELLHPHYNDAEVQDELSILVSRGKTLEEAYEASPRVKMLDLEQRQQAVKKNDAIENRKKVAKAKRASLKVNSKKTDFSDFPSLKDELKARYFSSSN